MWKRSNRSRHAWAGTAVKDADEKLVGFRISERKYKILTAIAEHDRVPITQLINEALDAKFKLSKKLQKQQEAISGKEKTET